MNEHLQMKWDAIGWYSPFIKQKRREWLFSFTKWETHRDNFADVSDWLQLFTVRHSHMLHAQWTRFMDVYIVHCSTVRILDASMNYQARQWREKQPQFTFIVVQARLYCPLSHKQIQYQKRPKKMWIHSGFSLCFTCREWERRRENEQMQWVVNRFKVCWQYTMIMHYQNFEGDEMCAIAAKTMQSVSPSRWCYYWWHDPIDTLCVRTV